MHDEEIEHIQMDSTERYPSYLVDTDEDMDSDISYESQFQH